jgi:hypothetical protein
MQQLPATQPLLHVLMVLRLLQPNLWQAMQLLQGESGLGIGEKYCPGLSKI